MNRLMQSTMNMKHYICIFLLVTWVITLGCTEYILKPKDLSNLVVIQLLLAGNFHTANTLSSAVAWENDGSSDPPHELFHIFFEMLVLLLCLKILCLWKALKQLCGFLLKLTCLLVFVSIRRGPHLKHLKVELNRQAVAMCHPDVLTAAPAQKHELQCLIYFIPELIHLIVCLFYRLVIEMHEYVPEGLDESVDVIPLLKRWGLPKQSCRNII